MQDSEELRNDNQESSEGQTNADRRNSGFPDDQGAVQGLAIPCELPDEPQPETEPQETPRIAGEDETDATLSSIDQVMKLNPTYPPRAARTRNSTPPRITQPVQLVLPTGIIPANLPTYPGLIVRRELPLI